MISEDDELNINESPDHPIRYSHCDLCTVYCMHCTVNCKLYSLGTVLFACSTVLFYNFTDSELYSYNISTGHGYCTLFVKAYCKLGHHYHYCQWMLRPIIVVSYLYNVIRSYQWIFNKFSMIYVVTTMISPLVVTEHWMIKYYSN